MASDADSQISIGEQDVQSNKQTCCDWSRPWSTQRKILVALSTFLTIAGIGFAIFWFAGGNALLSQPDGSWVLDSEGFVLDKHDAVTYFEESVPMSGDSSLYTHEWLGAKWAFVNQQNMEKFQNNPRKYMVQFGGFCAYAIANGGDTPANPLIFTIYNEKLYVNINAAIKRSFEQNIDQNIQDAERNWYDVWDNSN